MWLCALSASSTAPSADEEASKKKEERLLVDLKGLHSSARWCVGSLIAPTAGLLALECVERATAFLWLSEEVLCENIYNTL